MKAFADTRDLEVERLIGALVDAGLAVILEAGVDEESVQIELDLWEALNGIYARERRIRRVPRLPIVNRVELALLSCLTEAAFRVALGHGVHGKSLDVALNIWEAFLEVMERSAALATFRSNPLQSPANCSLI